MFITGVFIRDLNGELERRLFGDVPSYRSCGKGLVAPKGRPSRTLAGPIGAVVQKTDHGCGREAGTDCRQRGCSGT